MNTSEPSTSAGVPASAHPGEGGAPAGTHRVARAAGTAPGFRPAAEN